MKSEKHIMYIDKQKFADDEMRINHMIGLAEYVVFYHSFKTVNITI